LSRIASFALYLPFTVFCIAKIAFLFRKVLLLFEQKHFQETTFSHHYFRLCRNEALFATGKITFSIAISTIVL